MARLKKLPKSKEQQADKLIYNLRWEAARARLNKDEKCLVREKPVPKHWM